MKPYNAYKVHINLWIVNEDAKHRWQIETKATHSLTLDLRDSRSLA